MNRIAEHRLGSLSAIVCQLAGAVPGAPPLDLAVGYPPLQLAQSSPV
jgi:hypothetical protein